MRQFAVRHFFTFPSHFLHISFTFGEYFIEAWRLGPRSPGHLCEIQLLRSKGMCNLCMIKGHKPNRGTCRNRKGKERFFLAILTALIVLTVTGCFRLSKIEKLRIPPETIAERINVLWSNTRNFLKENINNSFSTNSNVYVLYDTLLWYSTLYHPLTPLKKL